jgi:hypothetical protein
VYGCGVSTSGAAAVVKFGDASGSGTNLGLKGLVQPAGVFIDNKHDVVVSDYGHSEIRIYPPGKKSPSKTISDVPSPRRSAVNDKENAIPSFLDRPCALELTGNAALTIPSDLSGRHGAGCLSIARGYNPRSLGSVICLTIIIQGV